MKRIQWLITGIVLILLVGTGMELLLIGHYEDTKQLIPLILITTSFGLFLVTYFNHNQSIITFFRIIMALCVISGIVGCWFHLEANFEFENEMYPTLGGWSLFKESLSGAIPALAPGSMIVIGMIGYLYTLLKTISK